MLGNRPIASSPLAASSSHSIVAVCAATVIRAALAVVTILAAKATVTIKGGCNDCN
jgi:hypothetical protein